MPPRRYPHHLSKLAAIAAITCLAACPVGPSTTSDAAADPLTSSASTATPTTAAPVATSTEDATSTSAAPATTTSTGPASGGTTTGSATTGTGTDTGTTSAPVVCLGEGEPLGPCLPSGACIDRDTSCVNVTQGTVCAPICAACPDFVECAAVLGEVACVERLKVCAVECTADFQCDAGQRCDEPNKVCVWPKP